MLYFLSLGPAIDDALMSSVSPSPTPHGVYSREIRWNVAFSYSAEGEGEEVVPRLRQGSVRRYFAVALLGDDKTILQRISRLRDPIFASLARPARCASEKGKAGVARFDAPGQGTPKADTVQGSSPDRVTPLADRTQLKWDHDQPHGPFGRCSGDHCLWP